MAKSLILPKPYIRRRGLITGAAAIAAMAALPKPAHATAATWDPSNSSPYVALDGSNLIARNCQYKYVVAHDVTNNKMWVLNQNTGKWNDDVIANQNPATGTGGYSPSAMNAGPYYPMMLMQGASLNVCRINGGVQTIVDLPSGFSTLDSVAGSTTTWNTSYNTQCTYSDGNLTATRAGAAGTQIIVRASNGYNSGKVCYEIWGMALTNCFPGFGNSSVANTSYMHDGGKNGASILGNWFYNNADSGQKALGSAAALAISHNVRATKMISSGLVMFETTINYGAVESSIGWGNSALVRTTSPGASGSIALVKATGASIIVINGSGTSGQDSPADGSKVGWYLNWAADLAWYYVVTTGRYNSSGTADPATLTGGYSISAFKSSGLWPISGTGNSGVGAGLTQATANFGATAFSGPVPSGYVSVDAYSPSSGGAYHIFGQNSPARRAFRALLAA